MSYYFFQKNQVTQSLLPASSFKQTPFFSDELSTIRIRLSQQNDTSHNELKYLSEYYLLATITVKNKTFIMTIYPNTFMNNFLVYNVTYSSLFENFNPLGIEMNFPTIGYESCSTLRPLIKQFPYVTVKGSEYLEGCKDINDEFYENVKEKIFVYMFQVVESSLTSEYKKIQLRNLFHFRLSLEKITILSMRHHREKSLCFMMINFLLSMKNINFL